MHLHLITGPMRSGKTTKLRELSQILGVPIVRCMPGGYQLLEANKSPVRPADLDDIEAIVEHRRVLLLDEVQFAGKDLTDALFDCGPDECFSVVAAGLRDDYRGRPWDVVSELERIVDTREHRPGTCARCGDTDAHHTIRVSGEGDLIVLDKSGYETACCKCAKKHRAGKS